MACLPFWKNRQGRAGYHKVGTEFGGSNMTVGESVSPPSPQWLNSFTEPRFSFDLQRIRRRSQEQTRESVGRSLRDINHSFELRHNDPDLIAMNIISPHKS